MGVTGAIDITGDQRKTILGLLKMYLPNVTVWAYGSRVKWTARPQSDLDMVAFASLDQKRQVSDLVEAFEESTLPFRVDLFVWDEVPEQFRGNIESEHVTLQEESKRSWVMGSEWTEAQLNKVAKLVGGFAFKSNEFTRDGMPVVKIKNVRHGDIDLSDVDYVSEESAEICSRFFVKNGDVLISMTGSRIQAPASIVGRVARHTGADDSFLINQRVGRFLIHKKDKLDLRYLYYYFSQRNTQLELVSIATGSANQVNLSATQIESLEIPLPPLPEQKAIAHILGSLDDKIELNRRMNATLEGMAQALFKSWFVDFDPVIDNILLKNMAKCPSANLSQRERNLPTQRGSSLRESSATTSSGSSTFGRGGGEGYIYNGIPEEFATRAAIRRSILEENQNDELGMLNAEKNNSKFITYNSSFSSLFPAAFQHTESMGWIPEGWEVIPLSNFEIIVTGKTPPKAIDNAFGENSMFLTPTDYNGDILTIETKRRLSTQGEKSIRSSRIKKDSICVTCIGSQMGRTTLVTEEAFTNQQINSISSRSLVHQYYILINLRLRQDEIFAIGSSGSTMPIVNKGTFSKLPILKPNEDTLEMYNKYSFPVMENIKNNSSQIQTLTKLRDTLLPKLISGELRIPRAEKLAEEVML